MNNTCKAIWSHVHHQMVVVSELVSGQGKSQSTRTATAGTRSAFSSAFSGTFKRLSLCLAIGFGALVAGRAAAQALPTGGQVAAGQASISSSGANMVVDQSSQRAVVNWQSFNVGAGAQVHFNQPSSSASTLNRVTGPEASTILGRITAPGQVIISNGNGVFFGRGSQVDVGSLVATTHSISDDNFMAGQLRFDRNGATGSVVNEGQLRAQLEGYIALLAPEVRNEGLIVAHKGTVALAAGEVVELQLDPSKRLANIRVEAGQWQALVDNRQAIEAEGGLVILSAMAARELQGSVVNNSGSINASSLSSVSGRIMLTGDDITLQDGSRITATGATGGGQVLVGGDWQGSGDMHQATTVTMAPGASIDASATTKGDGGKVVLWSDLTQAHGVTTASGRIDAKGGALGGDGGKIETSGHDLKVDGIQVSTLATRGKTGQWLLDPYNITISTGTQTGVDANYEATANSAVVKVSTLQSALNSSNVTVYTGTSGTQTGNITVSNEITSGSAYDLELKASGNIFINANITRSGTGGLTLRSGADVNINANLDSISTGGGFLVKASGNLSLAAGKSITTGGGDVVLWSNSDGQTTNGSILLRSGSSIATSGGHVWLGGGSGTATWNGLTVGNGHAVSGLEITPVFGSVFKSGLFLENTSIQSGGGDVAMYGRASISNERGWTSVGTLNVNAGSGKVVVEGVAITAGRAGIAGHAAGLVSPELSVVSIESSNPDADAIQMTFDASQANNMGLAVSGTMNVAATGGGGISLVSEGSTGQYGLRMGYTGPSSSDPGHLNLLANSGQVNLSTRTGAIRLENADTSITLGFKAGSAVTSSTSTLRLVTDNLSAAGAIGFNTAGALTIEPFGSSFTADLNTSLLSFSSNLSGLTLGKSGNTRAMTVGSTTSIAGDITLYGGNIAVNGVLTSTGNINLHASGSVTQSAAITAVGLGLHNTGNFTLTNTGNNIGTLAGGNSSTKLGNVNVVNANPMAIGTVNPTGITSTGTVRLETLAGDLTLTESISTTSTAADAVVLNAGKAASPVVAAGTADTSGNIVLSASPSITTGAGGGVKLYTGSLSNSTGLAALASSGSASYFRYHADETTNFATGNWLNLSSGERYVIYREQPSLSLSIDDKTITYGDTPSWAFGISGTVNGDTFAKAFGTAPAVNVSGTTSGTGHYTAGSPHTLSSVAADAVSQLGYAVGNISDGALTVNQKALTFTGTVNSRDYDGTTTATVGNTVSGKVGSDAVNATYTSATFDTKNVGTGKTVTVSGIGLSGADADNYSIAAMASPSGDINRKTVTLSASKSYDGTTGLSGHVTVATGVSGETLSYSGATSSNAHVATANKYINAITLANATDGSGGLASNYQLPSLSSSSAGVNTVTISARPLGSTAVITPASKVYDGTVAATGSSLSGGVYNALSGDDISLVTGGLVLQYNDSHAATNKTIRVSSGDAGFSINSSSYGSQTSDYSLAQPAIDPVEGAIIPKTLSVALTNTGVTKTYDGSTSAPSGFAPSWVFSGLVSGDTAASMSSTGIAYDSKDVASASKVTAAGLAIMDITGSNSSVASDYVLDASSKEVLASITAKMVTVSGLTVADKTYDGRTDATVTNWGSVSTGVGNETLVVSGVSATFANANAGNGKTVTATGYSLANGSNGGLASNYQLSSTSASTTADIAKVALTVRANNDAKFLTEADASGYNGVSYSGFVNGETAGTAGLTGTLAIARSGSDTAAGTYSSVLVPSGLSANNYNISYTNGDYTIVPSNQLLVRLANASNTYGTATSYSIDSVAYYNGSAVVRLDNNSVSGASASINGSNVVAINDGVGGSAQFGVGPVDGRYSTTNKLAAGSYQLGTVNAVTENSVNFSNTVTVVGAHQVNTQALTASAGGGVSRVYDGTIGMNGVTLSLATPQTNDLVTVNGAGAFASKNVGSGLSYTLSNLKLSGADGANYHLSGGTSFSGSNGTITARPLTVVFMGVDKVYDGNTAAQVTTNDHRLAGDSLTISAGAAFADKNVGASKAVFVSGVLLTGDDAANYSLASSAQTSAAITRLSSVTWIGGSSGNWFDPANWTGGAVPDLSNVANVVIPSDVQVQFDTSGAVAPAEASQAVNIIGLGNAGSLTQANGMLNIGTGGMTLAGYTQNGGVLTNAGETHLGSFDQTAGSFGGTGAFTADRFSQSGGSTALAGDFTVTQDFDQGASGTLTVGGNTHITDTSGGIRLGSLSTTGSTTVVSLDGAITQSAGTVIESGGAASLTASNGATPPILFDIHLDGSNNDFQSTLTLVGNNATVHADGPLVVTLNLAGDSTLAAAGNLSISGNTHNLITTSTAGNIVQHGPLIVSGFSRFNATTGDVLLVNEGNRLESGVQANGRLVNIRGDIQGDAQRAADAAVPAVPAVPTVPTVPAEPSVPVVKAVPAVPDFASIVTAATNGAGSLNRLPVVTENLTVYAGPSAGSMANRNSNSDNAMSGSNTSGVKVEILEGAQSTQEGLISVTLPPQTSTNGTGFVFSLPAELVEKLFEPVGLKLEDGSALPAWLSFNPQTGEFTAAAVPDRAFPIQVHISWDSQKMIVVISERKAQ